MAGKHYREGVTLLELGEKFPTEESARIWFEELIWPNGRHCPRCGAAETVECTGAPPMPYWCPACKRHFSVRIGTVMERSPLPFRKWVYAIYLHLTSLKGVSSVKLGRDIGVRQATAWHMLQRIRKAFDRDATEPPMAGPAEADEAYFGGRRKNMSLAKRKALTGRGAAGKEAVVGVKDRATGRVVARHVARTDAEHIAGFVAENVKLGAILYSDEARVYQSLAAWYKHEAVNHGMGEYVRQQAHTNGMESFWSMMKRAHKGVYHKFSPKHLHRYIAEFAGRHNMRERDTLEQMAAVARGMAGKRLPYAALIADNGLDSGARA